MLFPFYFRPTQYLATRSFLQHGSSFPSCGRGPRTTGKPSLSKRWAFLYDDLLGGGMYHQCEELAVYKTLASELYGD